MEWLDNLRIRVTTSHGSFTTLARSSHILQAFGLKPSSPIPANYAGNRTLGNITVSIVTKEWMQANAGTTYRWGGKTYKMPRRRVMACCPVCGIYVCAGHLHQHMKVH